MAQFMNDDEHSFPFMQEHEYPTTTLPHTNSVFSPSNTATMQDLVSNMQGLRLSHPYYRNTFGEGSSSGFHNYYPMTNHANDDDEATFYRTRILHAAATTRVPNCYDSVVGSRSSLSNDYVPFLYPRNPRGLFVSMAMDESGFLVLQHKIEVGTPKEIDAIIFDLKDHVHDLMKHYCGNYVIQKLFQTSTVSKRQVNAILSFIIKDLQRLKDVCMDYKGNRVVQKMIEGVVTTEAMYAITAAIAPITVSLITSANGGYVIEQCMKRFPSSCNNVIFHKIVMNNLDILRNQHGCRAIQKCWDYAEEAPRSQLVQEIISNAKVLTEDPFGNYVMQFVIEKKMMLVNQKIISRLRHNFVVLSMNKYASNVVETLLLHSEIEDAAHIILELMCSPEFLNLAQDDYGNFVVQKAIKCTMGIDHYLYIGLSSMIFSLRNNLESHPRGKKVLAAVTKGASFYTSVNVSDVL
ncbi:hypothetical protein RJT34_25355 [Clitoria ternatea]|uniref:PUM-HD domain-containing protein n=1 Tax=Clitoria ternatea TaxID=43366 RepID=A0AAN9FXS4_CLITE